MKKNLMSVLIFALVLVNLVLTAVLTFSILPATNNANALITKVAAAIDLELSTGDADTTEDVAVSDQVVYNVPSDGETMTINLKDGGDGEDHYAVVSAYITLNSKDDDYETYYSSISDKESLIKNEIINVISKHTKEDMENNADIVTDEILTNLRDLYDSTFIIGVGFSSLVCQ